MNNAERTLHVVIGLHDLQALRRMSDTDDPRLLSEGLRVLHEAEQLWFDVPRISLFFSLAKQRLLYDALRRVPPGDSLHAVMRFMQTRMPNLPEEEKRMLDIADDAAQGATDETQRLPVLPALPARTYPRRVPGEALDNIKTSMGLPQHPRRAGSPTQHTVETLERVLKGLHDLPASADGC